jgi:biofilm PGA synthesis N-glycosyltransferase PgaC
MITDNAKSGACQPVSIIIAAYNEERFIRDKILSVIDKEYWIEGSEVIVVSAGSTDNTNLILKEFCNHGDILLMIYHKRLSKIEAVNLAVSRSKNEILVFSDCRQRMKSGSIRSLLHNFSDASVGTVTATLVNIRGSNVSQIRTLLNCVALAQSKNGSCLNVFGALYAQRKSVYRTIPTDIIFDDCFVAVSTIVQGKRLIQEKDAIIYDIDLNRYYNKERLERLARGLLMFVWNHTALIMQLPIGFLIQFLGFKYLKLVCPFLLTMSIPCALYLIIPVISVQIVTIAALLLMIACGIKESRDVVCLFVRMNVYFMTAVFKFVFLNRRDTSWRKLELEQFQE